MRQIYYNIIYYMYNIQRAVYERNNNHDNVQYNIHLSKFHTSIRTRVHTHHT